MGRKCVILVGHGGVPSDFPQRLLGELKAAEAASKGGPPTARFLELDQQIRAWPRTEKNDPYKSGLEAVGEALRRRMKGRDVLLAYNEFCAPSLEAAVEQAAAGGATAVTVISTMYTRGGVHSEKEIPEILESLRRRYPAVELRYVWPYRLEAVAELLGAEVERVEAPARTAGPNRS